MELYHVLNRGVDKRKVVLDNRDRFRFVHDLFAFNDQNPAQHPRTLERREIRTAREPLVDVHAFCLVDNHYHLLLSERVENGMPEFMRKLNMGYAKYFNERNNRTGALWQGKYKKVLIERDAHFLYIPYYIHLNALDHSFPEWREGRVRNPNAALAHLRKYRWSSHLDYLGEPNFPSITERDFLSDMLGTPATYEKHIRSLISDPELAFESTAIE